MIDIIESICDALDGIESLKGHVYRAWPQTKLRGTFAVVMRISRQPEAIAFDGSELVTRISYTINLAAPTISELDDLEEQVTDLLASYNLHSTAGGAVYNDVPQLYRTAIVVSGAVDCRGNTFS